MAKDQNRDVMMLRYGSDVKQDMVTAVCCSENFHLHLQSAYHPITLTLWCSVLLYLVMVSPICFLIWFCLWVFSNPFIMIWREFSSSNIFPLSLLLSLYVRWASSLLPQIGYNKFPQPQSITSNTRLMGSAITIRVHQQYPRHMHHWNKATTAMHCTYACKPSPQNTDWLRLWPEWDEMRKQWNAYMGNLNGWGWKIESLALCLTQYSFFYLSNLTFSQYCVVCLAKVKWSLLHITFSIGIININNGRPTNCSTFWKRSLS